jgi:hypothetical protein
MFGDFRNIETHYDNTYYVNKLSQLNLKTKIDRFDNKAKGIRAYGDDPRLPVYMSKLDITGKKHQSYVTFINGYGRASDHSCKESWQLC